MHKRLLDYLFGHLSDEERREVEAALLRDANLRAELERLRASVDPVGHEAADEPPADLARRTCQFVAGASGDDWQVTGPVGGSSQVRCHPRPDTQWSTTDLAVAMGVVLATAMFFLPALQESRFAARRIQCEANLDALARPLLAYANLHDRAMPDSMIRANRLFSGLVPVGLVDDDLIDADTALACIVCPDSRLADEVRQRQTSIHIPTRREYMALQDQSGVRRRLAGSLGFRIGFIGPRGYEPWKVDFSPHSPLIADAPGSSRPDRQSDNHRGIGMNVLFADGHVAFISGCPSLECGDKLYLNDENRLAPGVDRQDAVLVGEDILTIPEIPLDR